MFGNYFVVLDFERNNKKYPNSMNVDRKGKSRQRIWQLNEEKIVSRF